MKEILMEQIVSNIGKKMNMLRTEQGLSLNDVAKKAGVSSTAIHKLERNQMTPTITMLMKIADALGKHIGFFLEQENNSFEYLETFEITPRGKGKALRNVSGDTKVEYLAFRLRDGKLLVLLCHLKPGIKSGVKPQSHPAEEFLYCLDGELQGEINKDPFVLRKGDALHFHAKVPHRWEVKGSRTARVLWMISPPPSAGVTELWKNVRH